MREIMSMLKAYNNPNCGDRPCIPQAILRFLEPGLESAERVDSRRSDPHFGYGSDETYRCVNANGASMTIKIWGNTDGWGMSEE